MTVMVSVADGAMSADVYVSLFLYLCVSVPHSSQEAKKIEFPRQSRRLLERTGVGFIPVGCCSGVRSMTPCGVWAITTIEEPDCARCPFSQVAHHRSPTSFEPLV